MAEEANKPWMDDSNVIDAAKFIGVDGVKLELKTRFGFKDDSDPNKLQLQRAAIEVMKQHGSSGQGQQAQTKLKKIEAVIYPIQSVLPSSILQRIFSILSIKDLHETTLKPSESREAQWLCKFIKLYLDDLPVTCMESECHEMSDYLTVHDVGTLDMNQVVVTRKYTLTIPLETGTTSSIQRFCWKHELKGYLRWDTLSTDLQCSYIILIQSTKANQFKFEQHLRSKYAASHLIHDISFGRIFKKSFHKIPLSDHKKTQFVNLISAYSNDAESGHQSTISLINENQEMLKLGHGVLVDFPIKNIEELLETASRFSDTIRSEINGSNFSSITKIQAILHENDGDDDNDNDEHVFHENDDDDNNEVKYDSVDNPTVNAEIAVLIQKADELYKIAHETVSLYENKGTLDKLRQDQNWEIQMMRIEFVFIQLKDLDFGTFEILRNSENWGPFLAAYYNNKYWESFKYTKI